MYICNRFFLCMIILRGRKRFFYKDSLVVFTHKFVNLRRKAPLVKGRPSFFNTQLSLYAILFWVFNRLWLWSRSR